MVSRRILIAVGHGRRPNGTLDPGACLRQGICEQPEGDPIVAAAAARLRAADGTTVRVIAAGGPNFVGATQTANDWGAHVCVEYHHDWSGAPRGAFGFWFPGSTQGRRLADAIRDAVVGGLGYPHRPSWHRANGDLHILRHTRMPTVLWECDRIGSVADKTAYGRASADGILAHLGLAVASDPVAPPPAKLDIDYVRYDRPRKMRATAQPTVLHDFGHPTHREMPAVRHFDRGAVLDFVGEARHHPTGSVYVMTDWSFGDADRTGEPRATNGINRFDLENAPVDHDFKVAVIADTAVDEGKARTMGAAHSWRFLGIPRGDYQPPRADLLEGQRIGTAVLVGRSAERGGNGPWDRQVKVTGPNRRETAQEAAAVVRRTDLDSRTAP